MTAQERQSTQLNWIQNLAGAKWFDGAKDILTFIGLSSLISARVCKHCSKVLYKKAEQSAKELDK